MLAYINVETVLGASGNLKSLSSPKAQGSGHQIMGAVYKEEPVRDPVSTPTRNLSLYFLPIILLHMFLFINTLTIFDGPYDDFGILAAGYCLHKKWPLGPRYIWYLPISRSYFGTLPPLPCQTAGLHLLSGDTLFLCMSSHTMLYNQPCCIPILYSSSMLFLARYPALSSPAHRPSWGAVDYTLSYHRS